MRKLVRPIPLYNIDGTENRDGTITEVAVLDMAVGDHREKVVFMVMDIGEEDVIISDVPGWAQSPEAPGTRPSKPKPSQA